MGDNNNTGVGFLGPTTSEQAEKFAQGVKEVFAPDSNRLQDGATEGFNTLINDSQKVIDLFTQDEVTVQSKNQNKLATKRGVRKATPPANPNPNYGDNVDNFNQETQILSFDPMYKKEESAAKYPTEPGQPDESWVNGEKAPYSLFNEWSLMKWRGAPLDHTPALEKYNVASANVPSGEGSNFGQFRNPTIKTIVDQVNSKGSEAYRYSYFDFALAKYTGKISNDYMLTLRRFPMPIEDDITVPPDVEGNEITHTAIPAMAQAVTWMSEITDNKLEDLLSFKVSTSWEEIESKVQEMSGARGGSTVGETIKGSSVLSSIYGAATGKNALQTKAMREDDWDPFGDTYPNHVYGPINVIKKIAVRQQGLDFSQDMEIKFHYNLRQIQGANPRVAFLDLMSNLLVLTFNNGKFWGGSVRRTGGSASGFNKPFGDSSKLASGDFMGFFKGLSGDFFQGAKNVVSDMFQKDPNSMFGFKMNLGDSKFLNNFLGGQMMDMFGTPQGQQAINAFLQGNATGEWHLTVGNPLNPIAVIGNLYCESADFQFGGEMSYDGFPTELTVTVSLKHARPRDKADIESMFNGGKGRMYLTPQGGVDVGSAATVSAYGNRDTKGDFTAVKRMTNG